MCHRESEDSAPELSIIMPAWNAEPFMGAAIDSVLAQSLEDFELVIYVDVSNDRTVEIAREYERSDRRVRVVESDERGGMCVALNRAISVARGSLIGRMDADDLAAEDRFARQVALLGSNPEVVVVGSNALHINREDEVLGLSIAGPVSIEDFTQRRRRGEITMVLDGTSVLRRDVFQAAGGYDPELSAAPEVDLHCRMAAYGAVVAIQDPLLLYRLHPGSSVATQFFEGRSVHRFVEAREQSILSGSTPQTYREFVKAESEASTWRRIRIRLDDLGQFHYREAGVHLSEGRKSAAVMSLLRAFVVSPAFVVRRAWRRRFSPGARQQMSGSLVEGRGQDSPGAKA